MGGLTSLGVVSNKVEPQLCTHAMFWTADHIKATAFGVAQNLGLTVVGTNDLNLMKTAVSAEVGSGIASLLVSIAEGRKTVSMIANAVRLLRHPIRDARQALRMTRAELGSPAGRKRLMEKADELWLEGRYGWRPLVYDAMSILEAAEKPRNLRFSARRRIVGSKSSTLKTRTGGSTDLGTFGWEKSVSVEITTRVGTTADYLPRLNTFAHSFGSFDPLGTAWDLVPYSFVVDWFTNIGDFLQSIQAYALVDERIGWVSEKLTLEMTCAPYFNPPFDVWKNPYERVYYAKMHGEPWSERCVVYNRVPFSDFLPAIGYQFNIDFSKVVDAIALLRVALRGR